MDTTKTRFVKNNTQLQICFNEFSNCMITVKTSTKASVYNCFFFFAIISLTTLAKLTHNYCPTVNSRYIRKSCLGFRDFPVSYAKKLFKRFVLGAHKKICVTV